MLSSDYETNDEVVTVLADVIISDEQARQIARSIAADIAAYCSANAAAFADFKRNLSAANVEGVCDNAESKQTSARL